jgi:MFS family permease
MADGRRSGLLVLLLSLSRTRRGHSIVGVSRAQETASAVALAVGNANVRRVELAWGAAIAAEWAHFVGLGVFAYRVGGTSAVGLAGLVRLLPAAIAAPVAASLADRLRRERFLLVVTLIAATALAGSAAAAVAGVTGLVYALAAAVGLSSTLIRPTLQALLPSLARTPEELIASNGATSTIESVGTLAGPLLAGALITLASVGAAFAAAAAIAAAAAVLLTRVRAESPMPELERHDRAGTYRELRVGFDAVAHLPGARRVLGLMVAQTFVRGCLNVLIVVAAFRILHAGAGAVGYMTAAIGVGGLVGAFRAMTLQGRRLSRPFALSLVFWGLPIALIPARPQLAFALLLLGVVGAANSIEDVAGFTLLQRTIPDEALNRVLALFWGLAMGAVALGTLAAPGLVGAIGQRPAFLVVGLFLPLITAAAYRGLKVLDLMIPPGEELGLIDQVPMFAPLSLATKERLATKLVRLSVSAGECVIRAGDAGDRFYVITGGEFDVEIDGQLKKLYTGNYFGEIALLRDVPRTATVTASADSQLYALRRNDFLEAVTGHPSAKREADAVVDARFGAGLGG